MISAVVLTHNNEKILKRTLDSLKWCGEIVVVDDHSADKTADAARKSGATVILRTLNDDFASQRNAGLKAAKGEWVLFIDSDEVVPDELAREVLEKTSEPGNTHNGYFIHRTDILWNRELKYGETANVRLLRLARKDAGEWMRPVHEEWKITGSIGTLANPILHYSHPDVAQFLDAINRYSTINARHFHNEKKQAGWFQIIAYPTAKFLRNYIWLRGFSDGMPGMIMAVMMSFHSFLTRAKLYVMNTGSRPA